MKETQGYTWGRQHEVESVMEDEHTNSEENKSQEMDNYSAMGTRQEQEMEQQQVVSSNADGRLHKKRPPLATGPLLEKGENEKRRERKRNKRICRCD